MDFEQLRDAAWITKETAAEYLGVSVRTVYRWEQFGTAPRIAILALQNLVRRRQIPTNGDWEGWKFRDGALINPAGYDFTARELDAYNFLRFNGAVRVCMRVSDANSRASNNETYCDQLDLWSG